LSTLIKDTRFVAIDFESAGVRPGETDSPVQIGMAEWRMGEPIKQFTSYIQCDAPITWQAQRIHSITPEDLKNAPSMQELWGQISEPLTNAVLVAHNHGTEKKFLHAFSGHFFNRWVDTLTISRKVFLNLESYQLEAVVAQVGLKEAVIEQVPQKNFHDALFDAVSSIEILKKVIEICDLADRPHDILWA